MPLVLRLALLCVCIIQCFGFKLNTYEHKDSDYISRLLDQDGVVAIKDIVKDDKKKYTTEYVSHLFEEISILDSDTSMIASDDNWAEVEKNMAHVQILQGNVADNDFLHFDISKLPRNIQISHVEVVESDDQPTNQKDSSDEKYTIFDVTKDFQKAYNSDASEFVSELYSHDFYTAQLVVFENINNTVLSSLRLRRKRDIRSIKHEFNADEEGASICSVKPWRLDFSVLGWSGWLWLPSSYNANLCSGSCFNNGNCSYSNHAIIKDYYSNAQTRAADLKDFNAQLQDGDLSVHCSPSEYSPLTILYLAKSRYLKMKQLPYMKVVSCMCR